MDRRGFLASGIGAALWAAKWSVDDRSVPSQLRDEFAAAPTRSVIPVVGDGKWIWTKPPEGRTGYLEPRRFELKVGIKLLGTGAATALKATTMVPCDLLEQTLDDVRVETQGCSAAIRELAPEARQLILSAGTIAAGQTIAAAAHFQLTLKKQYHGFAKEQFSASQNPPEKIRKSYLTESPGIQTRAKEVRELATRLTSERAHPWDQAAAFKGWVEENITARIGAYTSVVAAVRDRVGDCEERAAVFVALCRATGIPARLVWVPNHNWAEFYLTDEKGTGHWIPAHTSCYNWLGWTGAHELVLQKGDTIALPEKKSPQRLVADWMQWSGARPKVSYLAELTPLPAENETDPGPGARRKDDKGEWLLSGTHPLDKQIRDGGRIAAK